MAILKAMKIEGPVQENFLNSKKNEAKIEYLENRSLLNNRVAKVNEKMSEINKQLIEVNDVILKSNEEIVAFNSAQIETNTKLLEGIKEEKATP
jgi:preprotein translocase subunit SecA